MKLQATVGLIVALALGTFAPLANAAITPTASPVAPITRNSVHNDSAKRLGAKAHTARVARAAICTEDISQIKFQEYYVDWTLWMSEVGERWTTVFNAGYNSGRFHTDGPAFVQFTCKADGSISEIALAKSSGDSMCDRGQIEALVNCMPLPAFPIGSAKKTVTLMYVWEYGQPGHFVRTAQKQQPVRTNLDGMRTSITGKLM
jgi:TonB family protein